MSETCTSPDCGPERSPRFEHLIHLPLPERIEALAGECMERSLAVPTTAEPIGGHFSRGAFLHQSMVRHHGRALPIVVAWAVREHTELDVRLELPVPIAANAADLVASVPPCCDLTTVGLLPVGDTVGEVHVDLAIIDRCERLAKLLDVKRGSNKTDNAARGTVLRKLRRAQVSLPAQLAAEGVPIERVSAHVLDVYGQSAFPPEHVLRVRDLDHALDIDLPRYVELLEQAFEAELTHALRGVIGDAFSRQMAA